MKWYELIFIIGAIVSAGFLWYQLYKMIETDALSRGLKHPRFWSFFASGQENRQGLLLYLIGRRKFVSNMSQADLQLMNQRKKRAGLAIVCLLVFSLAALALLTINHLCVWGDKNVKS